MRSIEDLHDEIDQLTEFLYDDYADTLKQLGKEKTEELERRLHDLKREIREALS